MASTSTKRQHDGTMKSASTKRRAVQPLIFLDVDGVLNCAASRAAAVNLYLTDKITSKQKLAADAAAPSLLSNLDMIVQQTGAKCVLSSTWRLEESTRAAVEARLSEYGIELCGVTPEASVDDECVGPDGEYSPAAERVLEIQRWIQTAGSAARVPWIAIDDMDLVGESCGEMASAHFVHTDDTEGLTRVKAEEAVSKLLAQHSVEAERQGSRVTSPAGVKRFVVQDSWEEEDDVELREHLAASGVPTDYLPADEILSLQPEASTMVFADTGLVQRLLGGRGVVDTYPAALQALYKRSIRRGRLDELCPELPYFVKKTGSDKSFTARVVRSVEEAQACANAVGEHVVYVCETRDFVSEHRLFLRAGAVWGTAEYSEWMVGHRLTNADDASPEPLAVVEASPPEQFVEEVAAAAADLGFVVVDVGLTREGDWCVVEANPPFALSSYDLDIGVYVDYCIAAWQHLVPRAVA